MKHAKLYIILSIIIILNIVYIFVPKSTYVCYTDESTLSVGMFVAKHDIYYELSDDEIMSDKDVFYIRYSTEYDYMKMWKFKAEKQGSTRIKFYSIYQGDYKWEYLDDKVVNVIWEEHATPKGELAGETLVKVDENNKFVENYTPDYIWNRYRLNIYIIAICVFLFVISKLKIMKTASGRNCFIIHMDRVFDILLLFMWIIFFQTRLYAPFVVLMGMIMKRIFAKLNTKTTLLYNVIFTVITGLFIINIILKSTCLNIIFLPLFLFAVAVLIYAYIAHMKQIVDNKNGIYIQETEEYVSYTDKLKEKNPFVKKLPIGVLSYLLWLGAYICKFFF